MSEGLVFLISSEIDGVFTQGSQPGRTIGEAVGGIFEIDSSDWSNRIRYHAFDTRSDTEFKLLSATHSWSRASPRYQTQFEPSFLDLHGIL